MLVGQNSTPLPPPPLGLLHVRKLIYAEQLRPEMELFLMENFLSFFHQPRSLDKEQLHFTFSRVLLLLVVTFQLTRSKPRD